MCPLCLASVVGAIVAATTSTSAVAALAVKATRSKKTTVPNQAIGELHGTQDRLP